MGLYASIAVLTGVVVCQLLLAALAFHFVRRSPVLSSPAPADAERYRRRLKWLRQGLGVFCALVSPAVAYRIYFIDDDAKTVYHFGFMVVSAAISFLIFVACHRFLSSPTFRLFVGGMASYCGFALLFLAVWIWLGDFAGILAWLPVIIFFGSWALAPLAVLCWIASELLLRVPAKRGW